MSINQGVLEIIREIFISPITFRKTLAKAENKYLSNKKKGFLEFLQNSQENTCVRVPFLIKLLAWGLNFIKKETLA